MEAGSSTEGGVANKAISVRDGLVKEEEGERWSATFYLAVQSPQFSL